jgi:toxin CptA
MSSKKYAAPFSLIPEVSRRLTGLLFVGHGGAIILLYFLALPVVLRWFIAVGLVANLIVVLRKQSGRPGPGNVRALLWQAEGDWMLDIVGVGWQSAQLLPSTYAHPWLVVLNFRLEEERRSRSVVLLPDAIDGDNLRRLRVRLQVEAVAESLKSGQS